MPEPGRACITALPATGAMPEGVVLWLLALDIERPAPAQDWSVLSPAEVAHAKRLHQAADVVRSVCTRAALRRLLGARIGLAARDVPLEAGRWGRPRLAGMPQLDFNVSHAGRHALVALAEGGLSVGVDIECHAAAAPAVCGGPDAGNAERGTAQDALEALVMSSREKAAPELYGLDFLTRWTAKEAVLKCLGLGVAQHLGAISVSAPPLGDGRDCGARALIVQLDAPLQALPMQACALPVPAGYAAALAWTADAAGLAALRWSA